MRYGAVALEVKYHLVIQYLTIPNSRSGLT